jgi:hypothetical protein
MMLRGQRNSYRGVFPDLVSQCRDKGLALIIASNHVKIQLKPTISVGKTLILFSKGFFVNFNLQPIPFLPTFNSG